MKLVWPDELEGQQGRDPFNVKDDIFPTAIGSPCLFHSFGIQAILLAYPGLIVN